MRVLTAFALAAMLVAFGIAPVQAEKRVALVIGNGDYERADKLANPVTDARRLRDVLARLGFDVVYGENLGKQALERSIGRFANAAEGSDVALVYFAGHGATFGDTPYVVPVDAQFSSLGEVPYELVPVEMLVAELRRAKGLRIAILDACRDNTAERELKRVNARGGETTRGLARVRNPEGLILAYATQFLATAADGDPNGDSPFTAALLNNITTPGLDVKDLFFKVGREVIDNTQGKQRPEISVSFYDRYALVPGGSALAADRPATAAPMVIPAQPSPCAEAEVHWRSAQSIGTRAAMEDHIQRFPNCAFVGLAKAKLAALSEPPEQPSTQRPGTYWDHNGSTVRLEASESGGRRFYYYQPRKGMLDAGARPGDLVFEGRRIGNRYEGKAYAFKGHCGTLDYQVSGEVSNDDQTVVLTGRAPQLDSACKPTGSAPDRLVFSYKYKID